MGGLLRGSAAGRVRKSTARCHGGRPTTSRSPPHKHSLGLGSTHARTPIRLHFLHSNLNGSGKGKRRETTGWQKLIFFFFPQRLKRPDTRMTDIFFRICTFFSQAAPSPDNAKGGGRTRGLHYRRCAHTLHSLGSQHRELKTTTRPSL